MKPAKIAEMRSTAKALVAFGRGILAADESLPTRQAACPVRFFLPERDLDLTAVWLPTGC